MLNTLENPKGRHGSRGMIEKTVRMALLFDFYGQLLTERQREFFALYYDHDLSLGEIAQDYNVSRQAVYDILKRSTQTLTELEEKLELVRRHERQAQVVERLRAELRSIEEGLQAQGVSDALIARVEHVRDSLDTLR